MHQQGFFDRKGIDKDVRVLVFAKLGLYRYCLASQITTAQLVKTTMEILRSPSWESTPTENGLPAINLVQLLQGRKHILAKKHKQISIKKHKDVK